MPQHLVVEAGGIAVAAGGRGGDRRGIRLGRQPGGDGQPLYPYGSPAGPMTEHSPGTTTESKGVIRRDGWRGPWDRLWHVPSGAPSRTDIAGQLIARYGGHGTVAGTSSYQFQVPYVSRSAGDRVDDGVGP